MTKNKTKIVATIGPSCSDIKTMEKMMRSGVNVWRLNFSHGHYDEYLEIISNVRTLNSKLGVSTAILADLQGPKLRIGEMKEKYAEVKEGDEITFTTRECLGDSTKVYMSYEHFPRDVKSGERVLVDDGKLVFEVIHTDKKENVRAVVIQGGKIRPKKGVNLPNTKISQPSLTPKDLEDLEFALAHNVSWVALSFVRSASDIIELKHRISEFNNITRVIAKVEKPEAISDIDNIIKESDGVMVARGDLGIEVPLEQLPLLQKSIVLKCLKSGKPTIIATQMMESMISSLTPSRAEVNDVANAVMDGADAVMLSAETSIGKYPVEVIDTMSRIIENAETFEGIYFKSHELNRNNERYVSDSICESACNLAEHTRARAIVTNTFSGYTAYRLSSYRPKAGIYVFTSNVKVLDVLSLVWGVTGFYYDKFVSTDHTIADIKYILRKAGLILENEYIINIASMPINEKGMSNMIRLTQVK